MEEPLDRREDDTPEQAQEEFVQDTSQTLEPTAALEVIPAADSIIEVHFSAHSAPMPAHHDITGSESSRRRSLRRNLTQLLVFTLAAFILTAWILVRLDSSFLGAFLNGPQDVVRAQLQALDEGQIRPAYDMFSPRYRRQVSFDIWRELIATHWRMFHSEVLQTGHLARTGKGVTLEMVVRGADEKAYRAQFMLIRMNGRWWIDDLHWAEEPDQRDVIRA
jgi:hypothetical protein